jgi:hypothetical protein
LQHKTGAENHAISNTQLFVASKVIYRSHKFIIGEVNLISNTASIASHTVKPEEILAMERQ